MDGIYNWYHSILKWTSFKEHRLSRLRPGHWKEITWPHTVLKVLTLLPVNFNVVNLTWFSVKTRRRLSKKVKVIYTELYKRRLLWMFFIVKGWPFYWKKQLDKLWKNVLLLCWEAFLRMNFSLTYIRAGLSWETLHHHVFTLVHCAQTKYCFICNPNVINCH